MLGMAMKNKEFDRVREYKAQKKRDLEESARKLAAFEQKVQDGLRRDRDPLYIIKKTLQRHIDNNGTIAGNYSRFVLEQWLSVIRKAPKLADPELEFVMGLLFADGGTYEDAYIPVPLIRPISEFRPVGKSVESQLFSLVNHLYCKYKMPTFLYNIFTPEHRSHLAQWADERDLFIKLAQGAGVSSLCKDGYLPDCLTKRMQHLFMRGEREDTIIGAVRRAQVTAFGGSKSLVTAVQNTFLREGQNNELFWQGVIQWFCSAGMLHMPQVGPMLDYLRSRRDQDAKFSMKGRTIGSVMRETEEWHATLAKIRVSKDHGPFPASGFSGAVYKTGNLETPVVWTVSEILTPQALATEGRTMKHCVFSYSFAIRKGSTSIWSLHMAHPEKGDWRVLTVEVSNTTRQIRQARGICNRAPTTQECDILRMWVNDNGLSLALYH